MDIYFALLKAVRRAVHRRIDMQAGDDQLDIARMFESARRSNAQQCRRVLDRLAESQR